MLKVLERKITLQLLVFYGLFVIPLLLGGVELYFFQHDALQQSAQQADLGLAQAVAQDGETTIQGTGEEAMSLARNVALARLDLVQLPSLFAVSRQTHPEINKYIVCDPAGKLLLVYSSDPTNVGQDCPTDRFLQEARSTGQPFVSFDYFNPATGGYVVSVATPIAMARHQPVGTLILDLSLTQLNTQLQTVQKQLSANGEVRIWLLDRDGTPLANTEGVSPTSNLLTRIPGLRNALRGKTGNIIVEDEKRDWLYSYVPVSGTTWTVAIGRPTDATFATVISFQHSLVIALVMLLAGASVFWFVMHGWVVAPLSRLAQAVALIKPDQTAKVTDGRLLAREKSRQDEIGKLVNAFSTMEEEIHTLFRASDEQSHTRLQTLDAIMRSMDEGVLLENPEGEVIYANARFTQFIGLSTLEMQHDGLQKTHLMEYLEMLIEEPELYHEALERAERGDGPQVVEFHVHGYYNRLGQFARGRRAIRMRLFQVRDTAEQVIGRGKIVHDVTRQNEAEQIKKNLLAIVSHELRTPLTAIKGYATSLLATDIELDQDTQRSFLQRIVAEEDRMAELVTSLLEMSQLEAGSLKLAPSLCRLDVLFLHLVETVKNRRPQICLSLPAEIPMLYVDRRRMEVVLRNLLENAQRYAGEEARIELSARYAQEPEEAGVYISITDNGPGLPEALTERIFERFYQVDGGRERRSSGVGLGLAICRGFVEAHGGRIWAENQANGATGAVFSIWLPTRLVHVPGARTAPFKLENAL